MLSMREIIQGRAICAASPVLQWVVRKQSKRLSLSRDYAPLNGYRAAVAMRRSKLLHILVQRMYEAERIQRREAIKAAYPGVTTDEQADTLYNMWSAGK